MRKFIHKKGDKVVIDLVYVKNFLFDKGGFCRGPYSIGISRRESTDNSNDFFLKDMNFPYMNLGGGAPNMNTI